MFNRGKRRSGTATVLWGGHSVRVTVAGPACAHCRSGAAYPGAARPNVLPPPLPLPRAVWAMKVGNASSVINPGALKCRFSQGGVRG